MPPRIFRYLPVLFLAVILALSGIPAVTACDDALLLLLTASDPESDFTKAIRALNQEIGNLGETLNLRRQENYASYLEKLMESWMQFSNRFSVNPPEMAKNDAKWPDKMKDIGMSIGGIRKAIHETHIQQAHDETLALSVKILNLFEAVNMSSIKRAFLYGSRLLEQLGQSRAKRDPETFGVYLGQFNELLATFTPQISSLTASTHHKMVLTLKVLKGSTTTPESFDNPQIPFFLTELEHGFKHLRTLTLAREWFPGIALPQTASATLASGTP
jgi:hypothetical protein